MSGEVHPDGQKLKRKREEKGWTQERLAAEAGVSLRTIIGLEKGKRCYPSSLTPVAEKLGILYQEAIHREEAQTMAEKTGGASIGIELSVSANDFDETGQLTGMIELLKRIINARFDITVTGIKKGSIVVWVKMEYTDALRLGAAYYDGELEGLGVTMLYLLELGVIQTFLRKQTGEEEEIARRKASAEGKQSSVQEGVTQRN